MSISTQELARVLFDRRETAQRLRTSVTTLTRWEENGLIHPLKIGRAVRYTEEEIQAFVERQRRAGSH